MAWFRVQLTEQQQRVVNEERLSHPHPRVREKMLVLRSLHCGPTRQKAAEVAGPGRATVERHEAAFRDGELDGLRRWEAHRPESEPASYRDPIRVPFEQEPARTIAEACDRLERPTGLRRGPSRVRKFSKDPGLRWRCVRPIPGPPRRDLAEHIRIQAESHDDELRPALDAAEAGPLLTHGAARC